MELGETILITGLGSAVSGLMAREVYCFWRWRRTAGQRRGQWVDLFRSLRHR